MNFYFWKRRPQITGDGFCARLTQLTGELQRQLGDVTDDSQREFLRQELERVDVTYRSDADRLRRHVP